MKYKRFLVKLRLAYNDPANVRDFGLGIFVNAIYSIANSGVNLCKIALAIGSFYVIITANYKLRKEK